MTDTADLNALAIEARNSATALHLIANSMRPRELTSVQIKDAAKLLDKVSALTTAATPPSEPTADEHVPSVELLREYISLTQYWRVEPVEQKERQHYFFNRGLNAFVEKRALIDAEATTPLTATPSAGGEKVGIAEHWAVTIRIDGDDVLTIETNCLSGDPDIDKHAETVRYCARQLLSFIGDGPVALPPVTDEVRKLRDLVQALIDNDPNELIADGGICVIDQWRLDAVRLLPPRAKASAPEREV